MSFSYPADPAPREIFTQLDVTFHSGTFYAVMGPSGSGKTTLFRLLSGQLAPHSGSITLDGHPIQSLSRSTLRRERMSCVFQDYRLVEYLSALANVQLAQEIAQTLSSHPNAASELLAELGLAQQRDSPARQLSGGEQQRVAIARALVNGQQVMLADEPTGALDDDATAVIATLLTGIAHERGVCVIVATHDHAVARHADVVFQVHDGRLVSAEPTCG